MFSRRRSLFGLGLGIFIFFMVSGMAPKPEASRMTKEELKALINHPGLILIDVRAGKDWTGSQEKIQGAVREDPGQPTKSWADKYSKDQTIVLYCA